MEQILGLSGVLRGPFLDAEHVFVALGIDAHGPDHALVAEVQPANRGACPRADQFQSLLCCDFKGAHEMEERGTYTMTAEELRAAQRICQLFRSYSSENSKQIKSTDSLLRSGLLGPVRVEFGQQRDVRF